MVDGADNASDVPSGWITGKGKALPVIDFARCTGCGWCVGACAPHVLSLHAEGWIKRSHLDNAAECTGCALCAVKCPFDAIRMVRVTGSASAMPTLLPPT